MSSLYKRASIHDIIFVAWRQPALVQGPLTYFRQRNVPIQDARSGATFQQDRPQPGFTLREGQLFSYAGPTCVKETQQH